YRAARQRLARLEKGWPGLASVEYPLGLCAQAEGDSAAALAAWGRVTDSSPEATRAALARGMLALATGRFALAEECLARVAQQPGEFGDEARQSLGRLDWLTGRVDAYRQILRKEAEHSPNPSAGLRML